MSQVRWSRLPVLAAAPALAVLAVAGCSSGGSAAPHASSSASSHAAGSSKTTSYTAAQLRAALLTKINGQSPAAPVESGAYGSLAAVKATKNSMNGVTVKPAECAQTTVTGFNSPPFAQVPATVSTFRVGNNGVSEVLLAPSADTAALALRNQVPASCARYTATVKDKTFVYTVSEQSVRNLGQSARAMNIEATGAESINVWSVVYRASDFVGAITIVGPNATANVATTLAAQAYAHAAKTLH
ncbi:MAG TPA: hypothetical protein VG268_03760 [Streptosporangiaceae bacterium]|jgi:hypothetical protein|nr:hypothetical protein [Streptosporangiaceae bacterium]